MTSLRLRMLEDMQIRNLAVTTQQSYVQQVSLFARYFNQSPERLGPEQIRAYQVYVTKEKKLATGSILIAISALRFLYKVTLKKDWTFGVLSAMLHNLKDRAARFRRGNLARPSTANRRLLGR